MKPEMARLTLARKIAAITLTLWKKGARPTPLGWLYHSETVGEQNYLKRKAADLGFQIIEAPVA